MSKEKSDVIIEEISMDTWEEMGQSGMHEEAPIPTAGPSMWPLLRVTGDCIRVIYPHRELKIGDFVICRKPNGRFIAHRISWMDDTMLETLGDNLDRSDGRFPKSQVIAIVTHVRRKGKWFCVDTKFWNRYGRFMIWSNPVRMFVRNKMYRPVRSSLRKLIKGK